MRWFGWGSSRRPAAAATAQRPAAAATAQRPASEIVKATAEVDWARVRSPVRPQDLVLSPMAQAWLASFGPQEQPSALCQRFPRIANRLALCWGDLSLAARVLDHLTMDERVGRAGYPPEVTKDLLTLRVLRPTPVADVIGFHASSPWDDLRMAPGDR